MLYSLLILFVTVPLYFSHVFSPFGIVIGDVSSFERQKVYLFLVLLFLAYIEGLIRFPSTIRSTLRKYGYFFGVLIVLPILSVFYFGNSLDTLFWMGSYEKHHGYLFYIGILGLSILLMLSPVAYLRKYLSWSMYSAAIVACIAIGEHMGGIVDIYNRGEMTSMYPGRSSGTLGNPNYMAGYLLPFVAILITSIQKYRNVRKSWINTIILIAIIAGIYTTRSYIAIMMVGFIFIWYNIAFLFPKEKLLKRIFIFKIFIILVVFLGFLFIDSEKILSFESRFILMKESIMIMVGQPISFLIGFGPESILVHFSQARSALLNNYFPSNMLIDSSHNIIIDILFQYGIVPLFICIFSLSKNRQILGTSIGISFIFLIAFLSLNVIVISHAILLVLIGISMVKRIEYI